MSRSTRPGTSEIPGRETAGPTPHRSLLLPTLGRLLLLYFAPLLLLAVFFNIRYRSLAEESRQLHLKAVAEYLASTLDLFLNERRVNLANVIDDPAFPGQPDAGYLEERLAALRQISPAFVDLGVFDAEGTPLAYAGPHPGLRSRSYAHEDWFTTLQQGRDRFVVTDIYLGFRAQPHFTIAVRKSSPTGYRALRAALSPEAITAHITGHDARPATPVALVNRQGRYQLATPDLGAPLEVSPFHPPTEPSVGTVGAAGPHPDYAYSWLASAPWALVAPSGGSASSGGNFAGTEGTILLLTLGIFAIEGAVIWVRARQVVRERQRSQQAEAELEGQLVHAGKLAAVGELAAGIAHEINNPLAIVSEEAGLIGDLMNPEFKRDTAFADLRPHLDNIQEAVFRCRDITRKLLSFVRKTDIQVASHDVHALLDTLVDGFWQREMAVSNIEIVKDYADETLQITTDANQVQQVLLNILNNAADAISPPGRITLTTARVGDEISVGIADTGKGMSPDELERIFLPFYTTKDVGKGTGLGLSVSLGIVRSLGGRIRVESTPGKGSVFIVLLPIHGSGQGPAESRT